MANRLAGGNIKAGTTSVSLDAVLRSASDNTEVAGKLAADMTLAYLRQGAAIATQGASDLALVTSAFAAGGVKEASNASAKGTYRIDWPDAAFATGADWVELNVTVAGCFVWKERFTINDVVATDGVANVATILADVVALAATAGLIKAVTDAIAAGNLVGTVQASPAPSTTVFGVALTRGGVAVPAVALNALHGRWALMNGDVTAGVGLCEGAVQGNTANGAGNTTTITLTSGTALPVPPATGDTLVLTGAGSN